MGFVQAQYGSLSRRQRAIDNVANQILEGNNSIVGLMVESHLGWGSQSINKDLSQLKYGVSITDACIDWEATATLLATCHDELKGPLKARLQP